MSYMTHKNIDSNRNFPYNLFRRHLNLIYSMCSQQLTNLVCSNILFGFNMRLENDLKVRCKNSNECAFIGIIRKEYEIFSQIDRPNFALRISIALQDLFVDHDVMPYR